MAGAEASKVAVKAGGKEESVASEFAGYDTHEDGTPANSIIAVKGRGPIEDGNDGVVAYRGAHIDEAESELVVPWNHSCQGQPEAIEEIRRILLLHAGAQASSAPENGRATNRRDPAQPKRGSSPK